MFRFHQSSDSFCEISHKNIRYEIVFVDDNSPDGTSEEIQVFMKKSNESVVFAVFP